MLAIHAEATTRSTSCWLKSPESMFSWKTWQDCSVHCPSECISNNLKYYFNKILINTSQETQIQQDFSIIRAALGIEIYQSYEAVRGTSGKSLYLSCERNSALPPFLHKNTSLAALAQQLHLITFFVDRQNDTNFLSKGKERKVCPIQ